MNHAENSIIRASRFQHLLREHAPNPPRRARLASSVMKVCLAGALCGNGFYGALGGRGGGNCFLLNLEDCASL